MTDPKHLAPADVTAIRADLWRACALIAPDARPPFVGTEEQHAAHRRKIAAAVAERLEAVSARLAPHADLEERGETVAIRARIVRFAAEIGVEAPDLSFDEEGHLILDGDLATWVADHGGNLLFLLTGDPWPVMLSARENLRALNTDN